MLRVLIACAYTDTVGDSSERADTLALLHDGDLLRLVLPNQRDPRHRGHGIRRLPGRGPQTGGGTQTAKTSTLLFTIVLVSMNILRILTKKAIQLHIRVAENFI